MLINNIVFVYFTAGQQSRDLPPRFAAKLSQQPAQISPPTSNQQVPPMAMMNGVGGTYPQKEEISLRPAKNFTVFKPTSPSNLPRSAQGMPPTSQMSKMAVTPPEPPKPLLNKQVSLLWLTHKNIYYNISRKTTLTEIIYHRI